MSASLCTDHDAVAAVLTDAFTGDPVMSWLFPDPDTHVAALETWWGFLTARAPLGHELWVAGDGASAALWYAPRGIGDAAAEAGDGGVAFVEMVAELVGHRLPTVLELFGRIGEAHPAEPHWYLAAVGTRPAMQGRGGGAQVLAPVLERCDRDQLSAYLESSNPRNLAFYHRLGFSVTGEIETPDGAAILTAMWREPR